jgi:heat shock protein HslJ
MFRYMADAARFRDCHSGRQWPVAMTEGYPVLERAYGEHSPAPGGELLVTVIGRIDQRPKMEGAGTEPTLVVEQFVEAVLGSGCEPGGSREALAHNRWRPIRIGGRTVEVAGREREPWIHFESTTGRVTGFGGCNRITGTYTDHGDSLRVGPLASSRMACPSMDTENAFLKALDATRHYRVEGRTLELLDERGKVLALLEERNLR